MDTFYDSSKNSLEISNKDFEARSRTDSIVPTSAKVIIVGETGVGKTAILANLAERPFVYNTPTTIGVDYFTHHIELTKETEIRLDIWDTAGQEKYRSLISGYFKNSLGCVLVFDLTQPKSFEGITQIWLEMLNRESPSNICKVLLANKVDLTNEKEKISEEMLKQLEKETNIKCFKTSAKTGEGIEQAFFELAKDIACVHHVETSKQIKEVLKVENLNKNGVKTKIKQKEDCNVSSKSCC